MQIHCNDLFVPENGSWVLPIESFTIVIVSVVGQTGIPWSVLVAASYLQYDAWLIGTPHDVTVPRLDFAIRKF